MGDQRNEHRLADGEHVMSEEVEREDGASKGRYRIVVGGHEAEMTYSRAGQKLIIIDHTDVPSCLLYTSPSPRDS